MTNARNLVALLVAVILVLVGIFWMPARAGTPLLTTTDQLLLIADLHDSLLLIAPAPAPEWLTPAATNSVEGSEQSLYSYFENREGLRQGPGLLLRAEDEAVSPLKLPHEAA